MREQGLVAAQPRRKVRTTIPAADLGSRPDLVKRDSRRQQARDEVGGRHPPVSEPGRDSSIWRPSPAAAPRKWSGTRLGRPRAAPTPLCEAIDMAARRCPTRRGKTIFHSDRGSQYTSEQFARHLKGYDIRPSVGRTGVCWAGAWAESFNATLKNERAHANGVPHETQGHQRYCLVDRADIQSDTSSLGARVPDAQRGRTRFGKQ